MSNIKKKNFTKFQTELQYLTNLTNIKDLRDLLSATIKFQDLTKPEIDLYLKIKSTIFLGKIFIDELNDILSLI